MEGFRVVTAVGEKRVGRIVGAQGGYYVVRRSFGRGRYPLPKRNAAVVSEQRRVLMHLPRKQLFEAPKVRRNGELARQPTVTTAAEATRPIGLPIFIVAARRPLRRDAKKTRPNKAAARKKA